MKLGMIGRLFPALLGRVVYDYTARAKSSALIRNAADNDNPITPRQMRPYLLSIGFTESQISASGALTVSFYDNQSVAYSNVLAKYIRKCIANHTYGTVSAMFTAIYNEGYTRQYIDDFFGCCVVVTGIVEDSIRAGNMVDDINYFGVAPAAQPSQTAPTSQTTPTVAETTPAPVEPSTEPSDEPAPVTDPEPEDTQNE